MTSINGPSYRDVMVVKTAKVKVKASPAEIMRSQVMGYSALRSRWYQRIPDAPNSAFEIRKVAASNSVVRPSLINSSTSRKRSEILRSLRMVATSVSSLIKRNSITSGLLERLLKQSPLRSIIRAAISHPSKPSSWIQLHLWLFCRFFNSLRVSTISTKGNKSHGHEWYSANRWEDHALFCHQDSPFDPQKLVQIVDIFKLLMRTDPVSFSS